MTMQTITIAPLQDEADAVAFRTLNEEWITTHFALEDADRAVLADPQHAIVDQGGTVLIARAGEQRVGCVALLRIGDGVAELVKMSVAPEARGSGIGRMLITAAIDHAREQGITKLMLESNQSLAPAVRLYESVGFQHVPASAHAPTPYSRADVFMDLDLV
ncbi:GNAT family N-acetyltransferase [Pseudoclavibacter sp. RFBA6]|uniref:GNAT family N-acetyltransferase n=1 Tax=Pseudoclavibacter sp. RFBA6 TaxID=2080573 RepID=UPI000CE73B59|nr:GNAT family N-acetyltransferase [Pseudoclavibacter sp. RFBA6]PPG37432.1 GNAT family N-acetyltransferase [Pseudoclavibacter sp. RFBA6]